MLAVGVGRTALSITLLRGTRQTAGEDDLLFFVAGDAEVVLLEAIAIEFAGDAAGLDLADLEGIVFSAEGEGVVFAFVAGEAAVGVTGAEARAELFVVFAEVALAVVVGLAGFAVFGQPLGRSALCFQGILRGDDDLAEFSAGALFVFLAAHTDLVIASVTKVYLFTGVA